MAFRKGRAFPLIVAAKPQDFAGRHLKNQSLSAHRSGEAGVLL